MTYRDKLRAVAAEQRGYFTVDGAAAIGMPRDQLHVLADRNDEIDRVARGLYRFAWWPHDRNDELFEAVARVGPDAYLMADATLLLHDLADVNPTRIRVATPHRVRRNLPPWIEVHDRQDRPDDNVEVHHGIATSSVERAVAVCRTLGLVPDGRLDTAMHEGRRRGLVPLGRADVRPDAA